MGLEQTSIVTTVNNLGLIYADLGQLDEAEKMCQRTLTSYEKAFGPQSGENICIGAENSSEYRQSLSVDKQIFRSGGQDFLGVSELLGSSIDRYRGLRRALDVLRSND